MNKLSLALIFIWLLSTFYLFFSFLQQSQQAQHVLDNQAEAQAIIVKTEQQTETKGVLHYQFKVADQIYQGQLVIANKILVQAKQGEALKGIIYNQKNPLQQGLKVLYERKASFILATGMASLACFFSALLLLFIYRILTKSRLQLNID